ncbi:MAG TPA: hypothetical protein VGR29_00970 [Thermomicrobiales bacterium]|nr:hypothetical protein [Thermomicrobiales bacterium]
MAQLSPGKGGNGGPASDQPGIEREELLHVAVIAAIFLPNNGRRIGVDSVEGGAQGEWGSQAMATQPKHPGGDSHRGNNCEGDDLTANELILDVGGRAERNGLEDKRAKDCARGNPGTKRNRANARKAGPNHHPTPFG